MDESTVRKSPYRLAACAEMIYADLPFETRVRLLHDRGYDVEMWSWDDKDLTALAATGARFSSMTGYLSGTLTDEDGARDLLRTAQLSLRAAEELDCARLNVHGTGLDARGLPVVPATVVSPRMWLHAAKTLDELARLGERAGRVFTLENLNGAIDHPGVPFSTPDDVLALVESVGSPYLRFNLDLYHAQIDVGNLSSLIERALPVIGEIQVADVPGRCEPGTGEINYGAIASVLRRLDYTGIVALEGRPSESSELALERFELAFM